MHRERISNPLDARLLVEGVMVAVVRGDAKKPKAAARRVVDGRVIGQGGVAAPLNGADQPADHLRRVIVRAAVHRMHADRRLVLARIVHHAADECRQPVDRQARPPLFLTGAAVLVFPLLTQPGEFDVLKRQLADV